MLRTPKLLNSSKLFRPPSPPPQSSAQIQNIPNTPTFPVTKQCCKFSRRELTIGSNSVLLLLMGSQALEPFYTAKAEVEESSPDNGQSELQGETPNITISCTDKRPTKRAFLDIAIDREPVGRIIIGLYGDENPVGTARFSILVSGAAGITYRKKEFVKIMPNYVQHGGLRSYGVDAEITSKTTGSNLAIDNLIQEWEIVNEKCPGTKNLAGTVSIIVRDPLRPPPKLKLVARKGKLEIDQEEVGTAPNGTEFVIVTKDSPELDTSALAIGRVLEGMEVVERIGQVKTVQDNTSSPYFRVAKLIGDKRAVVAERGFNRPYSKVIITNCGLME